MRFGSSAAIGIIVVLTLAGCGSSVAAISPRAGASPSTSTGGVLAAGHRLGSGQGIWSSGRQYRLVMQGDGNLVEYAAGGRALWATGTDGHPGAWAVMQADGNLVVYSSSGQVLWASGTSGNPGAYLAVQVDANLVVYTTSGRRAWASGSVNSTMAPGERLQPGWFLESSGRQYRLVMQGDGNLVECTAGGRALWATGTDGHPGAWAVMQADGNLVVYSRSGQALWDSATGDDPGGSVQLLSDADVVLSTAAGRPIWSSLVSGWSDARLAAETVIVPAEETDLASADAAVAGGAGGVVLFGSSAPADLGAQIAHLRDLVPGHLRLLVMTDEEGGGVQRMANLVGNLPWAASMGAQWTPAEITADVAAVAKRMASYGVNMDLAPVVDVDGRNVPPSATDPDGWRSFSGTTSVVTRDGIAYAEGLEDGGVMPVLKHFPGLGGASGNTDDAPAHTLPWPTLRQVALPPFVAGIDDDVPAIMVSNASVPGLTALPASLSPAVIDGELVGTLHFRGLIVTDSLSAAAISAAGYSVAAAAVQALRAGADMVMYTTTASTPAGTAPELGAIVAAEMAAVAQGTLTRRALVAAATAVLVAR